MRTLGELNIPLECTCGPANCRSRFESKLANTCACRVGQITDKVALWRSHLAFHCGTARQCCRQSSHRVKISASWEKRVSALVEDLLHQLLPRLPVGALLVIACVVPPPFPPELVFE